MTIALDFLQDAGVWTGDSSHMYRDDCDSVRGLRGLLCLTLTGWLFTIVFTYAGFASLMASVVWGSNLPSTLRAAWKQSRHRR